jgi:hypothetical protein
MRTRPLHVRSSSHNLAITLFICIIRGRHGAHPPGHTMIQRCRQKLSQISAAIRDLPKRREREASGSTAEDQKGLRLTFSCTVEGRKPKKSASENLKFEYKGKRKGTYRQATSHKHSPLSSPSITTFPTLPIRNTYSQTPCTSNASSYPCKQRFRIFPSKPARDAAESKSGSVASCRACEGVRKCRREG